MNVIQANILEILTDPSAMVFANLALYHPDIAEQYEAFRRSRNDTLTILEAYDWLDKEFNGIGRRPDSDIVDLLRELNKAIVCKGLGIQYKPSLIKIH